MVKSYTVTCNRPLNYGAVLQTYGLNTALKKMGVDAKVLDYDPVYYHKSRKPLPLRVLSNIFRFPDRIKGKKVFGNFLRNYIPMSAKTYKSYEDICNDIPIADVYIAGSDQIWNCLNLENGEDNTFFLEFAPKNSEKVSYAASLAMPAIPNNQRERYSRLISEFDAVSVREASAVPLLQQIGIKDVSVVVDPVFLLDKADWDRIANEDSFSPTEDYVLVYGYNIASKQKDIYLYAKALAQKIGAKVYVVDTAIEDYLLGADRFFWNASPNCFVNLIRNARAVVTNSFHGTVFSIVYNIPLHFFTVNGSTNSRMLDLLMGLKLQDRYISDGEMISNECDYSMANLLLKEKKEASLEFLKNNVLNAK